MDTRPRPTITRRRVVTSAAWGAPAIVVASAVPALAASTTAVVFQPGTTSVVADASAPTFDNLRFGGASVKNNSSQTIAANGLKLTVTFSGTFSGGGQNNANNAVYLNSNMGGGWTVNQTGAGAYPTLVFTYGSQVAPGAVVPIPNGEPFGFGRPRANQQGQLILTFTAPNLTSAVASYNSLAARGVAERGASLDGGKG